MRYLIILILAAGCTNSGHEELESRIESLEKHRDTIRMNQDQMYRGLLYIHRITDTLRHDVQVLDRRTLEQ